MSPKKAPPRTGRDWIPDQGPLDQLLHLRTFPDPAALLNDDVVEVWHLAIDAALDIIVPAMKRIALVPTTINHGPKCVNKDQVHEHIGRIPL